MITAGIFKWFGLRAHRKPAEYQRERLSSTMYFSLRKTTLHKSLASPYLCFFIVSLILTPNQDLQNFLEIPVSQSTPKSWIGSALPLFTVVHSGSAYLILGKRTLPNMMPDRGTVRTRSGSRTTTRSPPAHSPCWKGAVLTTGQGKMQVQIRARRYSSNSHAAAPPCSVISTDPQGFAFCLYNEQTISKGLWW